VYSSNIVSHGRLPRRQARIAGFCGGSTGGVSSSRTAGRAGDSRREPISPPSAPQPVDATAFDRGGHVGKSDPKAPAESVALYEALLATKPEIERKGATMPYTSVNGNMFSLLTPAGTLALRLPAGDRDAFLKEYNTTLSVQYGTVMKEYVDVPASLLKNTRALAKYLDISYRYACSLRPKPTKRSPTAKKAKAAGRGRGAK
jgi:hypothetical protein